MINLQKIQPAKEKEQFISGAGRVSTPSLL
jgi:hypothetical protein